MIDRTFFITGLGRSGTSFLAKLMGRSKSYNVVHEWHLPILGFEDSRLRNFPIHRFAGARCPFGNLRKGYGEVNSYLRFSLDYRKEGLERLVPIKGIIFRDPRDVISSTMNRSGMVPNDFSKVCDRVMRMYWNLQAIVHIGTGNYKVIEFDRLVGDVQYALDVLAAFGIHDVDITEKDIRTKVNINNKVWFPQWANWSDEHKAVQSQLDEEYGSGEPPEMPAIR